MAQCVWTGLLGSSGTVYGHVWRVGKLKVLDQQELKNPTFSVPRSFHDTWGTAHLRRAPDASRALWRRGGVRTQSCEAQSLVGPWVQTEVLKGFLPAHEAEAGTVPEPPNIYLIAVLPAPEISLLVPGQPYLEILSLESIY